MHTDLSDQTVLVTGASRGIGRATATALAEAGATVAVHYGRSADAAGEVAATCGEEARPFQADLSTLDATNSLIDRVVDAYGRLDTLVLNAGVAVPAPMDASTERWADAWSETMHVNLRAPELLCRHTLRHFQRQQPSGGALTRSIARGFGDDGVKAFTVAPGFTRTDMAQDFIDEYGEEHATKDLALDRLTEPSDVASVIVFLASGQADHATGTTIDVNAGSYVH
ncbi:MAG: 3-oxoacyl-ACP reductase [Bacteroidetes bacterium SW_7_64_58]|nr:MAG: 3-oxoacyl-ACP reductase [Bacteroidetes bacterium SW_7_64_58]